MASNFIYLKSGYTQNIKNPILFNKLLAKPYYGKISANDYTDLQSDPLSKSVYMRLPLVIEDTRLFDKVFEELSEAQSNQNMGYVNYPTYYADTYNNTEEIDTTLGIQDESMIVLFKYSAERLYEELKVSIEGEYAIVIFDGENSSSDGSATTFKKISPFICSERERYINGRSKYVATPYYDEETNQPISIFKSFDNETDIPTVYYNDLLLNGYTIEGENGAEDEVIPGIKEYFYKVAGSTNVDLPSEEALSVKTTKKGITFEEKFENIESNVTSSLNSMGETVSSLSSKVNNISWSSLNGKPSIYNNYMSTYTFNDLYLNNLSTRSVTNYNYREVASGNNSISGNVYYNSSYFSYSNYSSFSFVSCDINFTDDFIDYIEDYGCFLYYQSGSYYIGIWIKLVDDIPETLNNKKIVISSSVKFFYSLYAG